MNTLEKLSLLVAIAAAGFVSTMATSAVLGLAELEEQMILYLDSREALDHGDQ